MFISVNSGARKFKLPRAPQDVNPSLSVSHKCFHPRRNLVHKLASPYGRTTLFAFHLFDVKWSYGASCARDNRASSEMYKPEESWWKHELDRRSRDISYKPIIS
jgi:hypothetical protein